MVMTGGEVVTEENRCYIAIDLKSFYASVECVDRGLDPMSTNLVVADASRTEKTICLAVSPSLKALGIPGRPRLFEVTQKVKLLNGTRRRTQEPEIEFITATPRMARYMEVSTQIYNIYLKYVAPEDIHIYSIDEVFIDATAYLKPLGMTARQMAKTMMQDVLKNTGITATAGIGTNLYLCKVAMDIVAKHVSGDADHVRIAQLDEMSYRRKLWDHRPLTDFWRVGKGYATKLEAAGLYTMGDIARCSKGKPGDYYNEELLYKMFGVNAELLIDHAWGWEPCTISDIKAYRPASSSLGAGQVLQCAYTWEKARLVVREMTDSLSLDLFEKGLVTDQLVLTIGYDIENLTDPQRRKKYKGTVTKDRYGRSIPKHAHGTENLTRKTSSTELMVTAMMNLYDRITDPDLLIRRINLAAAHINAESELAMQPQPQQMDLFTDYEALQKKQEEENARIEEEKQMQKALLTIRKKYGKNAVLKGTSYEEGATARQRNGQIGGHKA